MSESLLDSGPTSRRDHLYRPRELERELLVRQELQATNDGEGEAVLAEGPSKPVPFMRQVSLGHLALGVS
jgi:hypothetical protein